MKRIRKILIIAATHGDEKIGVNIVKELKRIVSDDYFDWIIGNPKAYESNQRYIEADLNRVYPGKKYSKVYEKRIAWRNLDAAKKYDFVVDVHEARASRDMFIIIPEKYNCRKTENAVRLNGINKVVWPSTTGRKTGPISQFIVNGLELEIGTKDKNINKLARKVAKYITNGNLMPDGQVRKNTPIRRKNVSVFEVYDKLYAKDLKITNRKIRDFKRTVVKKETFYPLLTDQYRKSGIKCYKMKKII